METKNNVLIFKTLQHLFLLTFQHYKVLWVLAEFFFSFSLPIHFLHYLHSKLFTETVYNSITTWKCLQHIRNKFWIIWAGTWKPPQKKMSCRRSRTSTKTLKPSCCSYTVWHWIIELKIVNTLKYFLMYKRDVCIDVHRWRCLWTLWKY